jgi:tetratricopeptide (TPR) repeat protein
VPVRLYLNHHGHTDRLVAIEFGAVEDGQPPGFWKDVARGFSWIAPEDHAIGFKVEGFSAFDAESRSVAPIWDPPLFCVPVLGLNESPAGEIIIAARSFFAGGSSVNRLLWDAACAVSGEDAVDAWRACLQSGDASAHFGLGVALYEVGRHQEAYRHLRHYAELAPHGSWNWCWYGKAAQALGNRQEARHAYEIAIELEDEGEAVTDAQELLDQLPERE